MKELKISVKPLVKPTAMDSMYQSCRICFFPFCIKCPRLIKKVLSILLKGKRQLKVNTKSK